MQVSGRQGGGRREGVGGVGAGGGTHFRGGELPVQSHIFEEQVGEGWGSVPGPERVKRRKGIEMKSKPS